MAFSSDRLSEEGLSAGLKAGPETASARRTQAVRRGFRSLATSVRFMRWLFAVWLALSLLLIGWIIVDSRPRVNASPNPPPSTWSQSGRAQSWEQFL